MEKRRAQNGIVFIEEGSGPAVVWIHGFPLCGELFREQLTIGGVRHIVPDLRGFGETRASRAQKSLDHHARDLFELLDELGIREAVFAGVSMGGYIAMAIARMNRERLRGLILIDTRETPDNDTAKAHRGELAQRVPREGAAIVIEEMLPKMLAPSAYHDREHLVSATRRIMERSSAEGVVAALQALADRPDSTATLQELAVPLLILVGSDDVITPPSDARRMAALVSGAEVVESADAGHLAVMEQPAAVNEAVENFLRKLQ